MWQKEEGKSNVLLRQGVTNRTAGTGHTPSHLAACEDVNSDNTQAAQKNSRLWRGLNDRKTQEKKTFLPPPHHMYKKIRKKTLPKGNKTQTLITVSFEDCFSCLKTNRTEASPKLSLEWVLSTFWKVVKPAQQGMLIFRRKMYGDREAHSKLQASSERSKQDKGQEPQIQALRLQEKCTS